MLLQTRFVYLLLKSEGKTENARILTLKSGCFSQQGYDFSSQPQLSALASDLPVLQQKLGEKRKKKRKDGWGAQRGLQVQETESKRKLLTLSSPPVNSCPAPPLPRVQGMNICVDRNHETDAWTLFICLFVCCIQMCDGNKAAAPCFHEQMWSLP